MSYFNDMAQFEVHIHSPAHEEPNIHVVGDMNAEPIALKTGSKSNMALNWDFPFSNAEKLHFLLYAFQTHFADRMEHSIAVARPAFGEEGKALVSVDADGVNELLERRLAELQSDCILRVAVIFSSIDAELDCELQAMIALKKCWGAERNALHTSIEAAAKSSILNNICYKFAGSRTRAEHLQEQIPAEAIAAGCNNTWAWGGGTHSKKFHAVTFEAFCKDVDDALLAADISADLISNAEGGNVLGDNNSRTYKDNRGKIYDAYRILRLQGYSEQDICG